MLYIDDILDHRCMIADFSGIGKVVKSRFYHFFRQKHSITLGETVYGNESPLLPPAGYTFHSPLEKLLKRCLILKQGCGIKKIDASDWREVEQMIPRMPLCPGIVGC